MVLIDPEYRAGIGEIARTEFLKTLPELEVKSSTYLCNNTDGAGEIKP